MLSTDSSLQNSGHKYLPNITDFNHPPSPNQELLPLTAKVNSNDCLEIGGCDLTELVKQYGSPLYVVDEFTLRTACRQYRNSFLKYYSGESQVIYASKAWSCLAICRIVDSEGLGFDVVSGGELFTTLKAGVKGNKIYFHGNNKSIEELKFAIESDCTIIIDNWLELTHLAEISAQNSQKSVRVMLRLTPGIECHTHEYIRTGHLDSKFGFDPNQIPEVLSYVSQKPSLNCVGLHAHIGSQIFERQPHQDLAEVLVEWLQKAQEYGLPIQELNVGGGLGICYTEADDPPTIAEWVQAVASAIESACHNRQLPLPKLIAEPGRSLVGSACVTAYTVGSRKEIPEIRTYIAVDGGMSDNPRPITYQSVYRAVIANRMSAKLTETVTVAGKHCESGDIVIKDALLPKTESGDILVVTSTGAYNYSMASNYNRIGRPAAILVNQGEANLIIQRESYQNLIAQDCLPARLIDSDKNKD
ncbi:diaminopimelate decarboxylase [Stanieria cyanosphaera PCC 7437]|uniref:Diaminopimelate decarboxylase n=1 Tax=Stanieria cyanosphaera (strain ATCC 29371 / PCC 7437) TaxID=111780 RepID=K9XN88_STAC7|nr:diaminopimelate decarboxylase [Stanieria cyanosphaera]AFZ33998.1 diaminopimelate decarboxylase [Stanieria cyanosphaera PCC 7437]